MLSSQSVVFFFQSFGLLGHLLHLLTEGQEEVITVVEGIFYLDFER